MQKPMQKQMSRQMHNQISKLRHSKIIKKKKNNKKFRAQFKSTSLMLQLLNAMLKRESRLNFLISNLVQWIQLIWDLVPLDDLRFFHIPLLLNQVLN